MPVDDHPVHEKTKINSDWRYGCHNHLGRKGAGYWAPNRRYNPDGSFAIEYVWIATEWIEYDLCPAAHNHQGCTDCIHKGKTDV